MSWSNPKAWVREVLREGKSPLYQVIFKAERIRTFKVRLKADMFVHGMNLLLKED